MLGDVNRALADLSPSFIRAFTERRRPTALNLGLGMPSINPDADLIELGLAKFRAGAQGYTANAGLIELRRAICAFRPDLSPSTDRMLVTLGSLEAMFISLGGMINPGDEVIVVDPAFSIYASTVRFFGGRAISAPMDASRGFPIEIARVEPLVTERTKAICLVSPGNPTGRALDEAEARAFAKLADQRGITLLVDEVYRELHHGPHPAPSPGAYSPRVITVGGVSKSCAMTGLRIGWVLLPEHVYGAALKLHQLCVTCAASLSQYIALAAYEKGAIFRHRPIYAERLGHTLAAIEEHLGQRPARPEGAFYVLVDVRGLPASSLAIAEQLMEEEDVVVIPGEAFGEAAHGFLRISFAQETDVVKEGIRRLGVLMRRKGYL
jgi:aspartate/methionine/tyrosine aminotransferase